MRRRRFTLAVCLALLLLPLLSPGASLAAGPGGPRPIGTASPTPSAAPDLAAMALWPSDVPEPGFGFMSSWRWSVRDLATWNTPTDSPVETQEQQFTSYGFQAAWAGVLGVPSDPSDSGSTSSKEVRTYLVAFDSADHAHQGYKLLLQGSLDAKETPDAASPKVGDESTSFSFVAPSSGQDRDLLFRTGSIVVDLTLFANTTPPAPVPALADAQALAKTLLAHIADVLKTGGPALSQHTLRLDLREYANTIPGKSAYDRLNGQELVGYSQTAAETQSRQARYGSAVAVYREMQFPTEDANDVEYVTRLVRFASASDAKAWFAGQVYFTGVAPTNLVERKNGPALGDQSTEFTFDQSDGNGGVEHSVAVLFRAGDLAVSVEVDQPSTQPSIASVEQLATMQAACLASDAPCAPAPASLATATE